MYSCQIAASTRFWWYYSGQLKANSQCTWKTNTTIKQTMQSKLYRVRSPLQILGSMWTFGPLDPSTSQARFTSGLIRTKSFGQFLKKSLKKIHFLIELDVAIWSRRLTIILILTPGLSQTKSFSSRLFKENNFWIKTFEITKLVM